MLRLPNSVAWCIAALSLASFAHAADGAGLPAGRAAASQAATSQAATSQAAASQAAASSPDACPGDELWLVSTRQFGCDGCSLPQAAHLDIRREHAVGQWQESSLEEFCQGSPLPTVIYVHGNRVDWYEAHRLGQMAHGAIRRCGGDVPRFRFVIWSWPSEQIRGPLRDIREKGGRADHEGTCFGWFVAQLPSHVPVTMFGYSYGARVISGGLHLLGGGVLNGITLPRSATPLPAIRAVYMAPAFDRCWLCDEGCHARSLDVVERLLILYNTCDPALARFQFSDRCTRPEALGYTGVSPGCLGTAAARVEQFNVACHVGQTHQEDAYWCDDAVLQTACRAAFHAPAAASQHE